ncbi:MAG: putative addiction module antidote protein [Deltaproteobacteria bacterium]|nr:putative addiction module antidote protein [Deltaproteobacteria bacterium]
MAKRTQSYAEGLDERLQDPTYAAEYLSAAAEEGRSELLLALRDVARARGVGRIARGAHRGRESLYKSLSEKGNPGLDTLLSVLHAAGLALRFKPA